MYRIVCAKWGDLYTDDDVNALYEDIKANCSIDFRWTFECFTEFPQHLEEYKQKHYRATIQPDYRFDAIQNGYHRDDFGGIPHYRKLCLFDLDKKFDANDTIIYLDLDSRINGDLTYFFKLNNDKPYLNWNYWWEDQPETWKRQYHITRHPLFNSSVMVWKPGQNKVIYDFLERNADKCFFTYPSMDTFLFHQFGPYGKDHFNYYESGIITSHRISSKKRGIVHMLEGLSTEEKLCI